MNRDEKSALVKFLVIYIGSGVFLVAIMLYLYYNKEVKLLKEHCNMWMSSATMQLKNEILDSHMKHEKFNPEKLKDKRLKYALYDKDKKLIYSYLENEKFVDLEKALYTSEHFDYFITTVIDDNLPIRYIVMETCKNYEDKKRLQVYILISFIISIIFIVFIAYFLAKTLLKPAQARVESMDKFIKDSAHELNTPVSVLMTSVSMLKKGKNPQKMMKYILSSSKQISQIYNDIHFSAFNEINEDVYEEFDLKDLISESVEFFQDISITKNIVLNSNLESCLIKMDRTKTQKLVNNLISNAIKYSKSNSSINISLKDNIFSVEDFGIGISPSEQAEIFKRYKRGNNIEGGFGIGLDIVKRVCQEYDLKLRLKSQLNNGSTFFVDFSSIKQV
ncbi:two-component sensor histidine kinase [Malaciobacter pacificus]|uniref:histidine kinase n=1 Tax=Malaciobacter pacificus TaxID=1080223 RepID=A0A5C2H8Z9_9BACT|nr:HAMP domain-containing sensor histidine kinase [Malaciobacter pacificus]QEP34799.1 two-component system sensor histidine kinase [Malaciobacter pacificus]GGD43743.1 two-component sensor histidine kinase [Malaciobacter pacificus]